MARRVENDLTTFSLVVSWVRSGPNRPPSVRVQMEPGVGYNLSEEEAVLLTDRIADCLDEKKPKTKTSKAARRRLASYTKGAK